MTPRSQPNPTKNRAGPRRDPATAARLRASWPTAGAALAVALLLVHALWFRFAIDDAWISFRYARSLLAGHGLVFNPGDPVEGYSNLLWVLLTAAGMAAGLDPLLWSRIMGFVAVAATALLLPRAVVQLAAGADRGPPEAGRHAPRGLPHRAEAAVWLAAACGPLACWSLAGLETPLFGLLIVLAWSAALARRALAAGIFGVLLALTRPEGSALGLAFAAWAALSPRAGRRRWIGAVLVVAGTGAHLLWRHATYGEWLPNTFFAKTGDVMGQVRTGVPYVAWFLPPYVLPWVILPSLVAPGWRRRLWRSIEWRRSLAVIGGWIAYTLVIGGDMLGMFRMFAPILPLVIACGTTALITTPARPAPGRWAAALALLMVASLVPSFVGRERQLVTDHMSLYNLGGWRLAAEGLARTLPDGTTIALSPVGYIAYRTGFVAYDLLGITDRHIAHRRMPFAIGYAGHEKHDGAYILSRRPDYLLLGNVDVTDQPRQSPIPPDASEVDIFENPIFRSRYAPVFIPLPEGKFLNCYRRVDAR